MRFGEGARVPGCGKPLEYPRKLCLDDGDRAARLSVKQPFKPGERGEIGDLWIALSESEQLVHAREITRVDQWLGEVHAHR